MGSRLFLVPALLAAGLCWGATLASAQVPSPTPSGPGLPRDPGVDTPRKPETTPRRDRDGGVATPRRDDGVKPPGGGKVERSVRRGVERTRRGIDRVD